MMDIHRIPCHSDRIVKFATIQNILSRKHIFAHNHTAFTHSCERSNGFHFGILKTRNIFAKIIRNFIYLFASHKFPIRITFRFRRIYPADSGHINPDFIIFQSCNQNCTGHRDMESSLSSLLYLVSQAHSYELPPLELFWRHYIHIENVRMIGKSVTRLIHIHISHIVHKSRRLHSSILSTLMAFSSCTESHVGISSGIDYCISKNCFPSSLALDDNAFHPIAILDHTHAEYIVQYIHAGFLQHLLANSLGHLRIYDSQAHMVLTRDVFPGSPTGTEPIDEFLRQTFDNLLSLVAQEAQNRQSDSKISTEKSSALDKHNFGTFGRSDFQCTIFLHSGCAGSHNSSRAPTDNQDIHFG